MYDIHNLNNQQLEFLKNHIDSAKQLYIRDNNLFMKFDSSVTGQGTIAVKLDPVNNVYLSNTVSVDSLYIHLSDTDSTKGVYNSSASKTDTLMDALKAPLIRLCPVQAISSEAEM